MEMKYGTLRKHKLQIYGYISFPWDVWLIFCNVMLVEIVGNCSYSKKLQKIPDVCMPELLQDKSSKSCFW